jgi:hypothetical protein
MGDGDVEVIVPPADAATDPAAFMRWDEEFWNEPEDAGQELIKAGILIEKQINVLEGHYEQGKTALMVDVARQWIELGRPALHLDYEMGKRRIKRRLKANLWGPAYLEWWHYIYMPTLQPGMLNQLLSVLPENPLITVDSYSQAMMYLAREENSATEAGNWWVTELQGAREAGATVLVIDQVKQSATARDRYAGRGTGAKSFGADVKWFVERFEKFTPEQQGLVKLTLNKDREGVLPAALGFIVGDGEGHLTMTPTEPPKGSPIDDQAVEAILGVIEVEGWSTPTGIKQKTDGFGDGTIRSAMLYLESKGQLQARPRQGKGGGTEYNLPDHDNHVATDVPTLD